MTTYRLEQHLRYDYSAPIRQLDHRLVVVPPAVHGRQRRIFHDVRFVGAPGRAATRPDSFGNHVVRVRAPVVEEAIEFSVQVEVDHQAEPASALLPAAVVHDSRFTTSTRLTAIDDAIGAVATELGPGRWHPVVQAERICSWVHAHLRYGFDATNVRTTAAQALALGVGVCQDYSHVMLALARACGLAARYVSGHMVGEGGSHAWVEILVEDTRTHAGAVAVAFDPTHDRRAGPGYLTVATGRDYADVAPTAGTFASSAEGRLTCRKSLEVCES